MAICILDGNTSISPHFPGRETESHSKEKAGQSCHRNLPQKSGGRKFYFVSISMPNAKLPPHNCRKITQTRLLPGFQLPSVCSKTSVACTTSAEANKETTVRRENRSEVELWCAGVVALTMLGTQLQFPISKAGHSQEGTCPMAAVCHMLVLRASQPQHGWEFHILSPSAAVQGKPGPLTDQTHTNPFFHCRATTLRKLSYAEEDFGFTTRTQCCGRPADKTFCLGKCSIELQFFCLCGCVMSSKGLAGGFAVRKVALSSWLPHTGLILPP